MMKSQQIAVLGSGIMGSSTALLLARRGHNVTLYDAAETPFSAASRWNEGKIHLGFIYSADPTLKSAREVIPGGLVFKPLVEELTGSSLDDITTGSDDIYLCHRNSVVSSKAMWGYLQRVAEMVRHHPDSKKYLVDVSDCMPEKLPPQELAGLTNSSDIVTGFRVPERSVATGQLADRFVNALYTEPRIEQRMNTVVTGVSPRAYNERDGQWRVETAHYISDPYDYIVNALWEGRMAVDNTAGIVPIGTWSNRYRLSVFVRSTSQIDAPSAIIATGPFGDIKNYNNRDFYLSWYPTGLLVDSSEISPPSPPKLDLTTKNELSVSIMQKLGEFLPGVLQITERIERIDLQGGWVYAAGEGKLSDPKSTLHRRSDFGIKRVGSYLSVDTGKYSTAPWLARKVADLID
jgi:FAD dependent oxidoreductase